MPPIAWAIGATPNSPMVQTIRHRSSAQRKGLVTDGSPVRRAIIVAAQIGGLVLLLLFTIHFALAGSNRGDE